MSACHLLCGSFFVIVTTLPPCGSQAFNPLNVFYNILRLTKNTNAFNVNLPQ